MGGGTPNAAPAGAAGGYLATGSIRAELLAILNELRFITRKIKDEHDRRRRAAGNCCEVARDFRPVYRLDVFGRRVGRSRFRQSGLSLGRSRKFGLVSSITG